MLRRKSEGTAGQVGAGQRDKLLIASVGIGIECREGQRLDRPERDFGLKALDPRLCRIGRDVLQGNRVGVQLDALDIFEIRYERGKVRPQEAVAKTPVRLEAQFTVVDGLGLERRTQQQLGRGAQRENTQERKRVV